MRAATGARRLGTALLAVLATLAVLSTAVYAAATKPDVTLQASPASQSIERAQTASYTVTVSSTAGFAGAVDLTATGLPGGSTASFAPATVSVTAGGSGVSATSVLRVSTSTSTPVGSSTLTVVGTSGKVSSKVTIELTVNHPLSGSLSMSATPASVTMGPGSTAVYALQLTRTSIAGEATLGVYGGLPAGATWSFSPNPTAGSSATLQVTTPSTTRDEAYTLYLVASGKDAGGAIRYADASVQLVISTHGTPFTIAGNLTGQLAPGTALPLQLSVSNPNKKALSVNNLSVTLHDVARTAFAVSHNQPCSTSDYLVTQYVGPYPLQVPGSTTMTLAQLGVPASQWPQITFLDRPVNQDGCKGATLTLAYAGSAQGN